MTIKQLGSLWVGNYHEFSVNLKKRLAKERRAVTLSLGFQLFSTPLSRAQYNILDQLNYWIFHLKK